MLREKHQQNQKENLMERINHYLGLAYSSHSAIDWYESLDRAFRIHSFGFRNWEEFQNWILVSPWNRHKVEYLAHTLTIGETYFLREEKTLQAFCHQILPSIMRQKTQEEASVQKRKIRIWSAGCSSGEEPFTLAMLIQLHFPQWKEWDITIIGTDINPQMLSKARQGIYTSWSFRNFPLWMKDRFFIPMDGTHWAVHPDIHNMVTFDYFNLITDAFPSYMNLLHSMDVIFCRNVMIYFSKDKIDQVVSRFQETLLPNGWLVVGSAELSQINEPHLFLKDMGECFAYRKISPVMDDSDAITAYGELTKYEVEDEGENENENENGVEVTKDTPVNKEQIHKKYDDCLYEEVKVDLIHYLKRPHEPLANTIWAMELLAKAYANTGNLPQAMGWCQLMLQKEKLRPEFYFLKANIEQELGHFQQAQFSLRQVLFLDPQFIMAHFNLGMIFLQQPQLPKSHKHFQLALQLLHNLPVSDVVPHSDGMTSARMKQMIEKILQDSKGLKTK